MRRKTRMAFGLLALATAVAVWAVASFGEAGLERVTRRTIESIFPGRATIEEIDVSWLPPSIRFREASLRGPDGLVRFRVEDARATLAVWASLWEGAWIADLSVFEPEVFWRDDDAFWDELPGAAGGSAEPSFLPRHLTVRSGRLRWELAAAGTRGRLEGIRIDGALRGLLDPQVSFAAEASGRVERGGATLPVDLLALRGRARPGRVEIEDGTLEAPRESLRGSGSWSPEGIAARVRWEGFLEDVLALLPEAGEVQGEATISADVSGTLEEPRIDAHLEARGVEIEDVRFSGTGKLRSEGDVWRLTDASVAIFGGRVEAEADGRWAGGIPYSVDGRFEGWDPLVFLELFDVDWPVRGEGSGKARLAGRLLEDDLRGSGSFRLVEGDREVEGTATFEVGTSGAAVEGTIGEPSTGLLEARYEARDETISGEVTLSGGRLSSLLAFVGLGQVEGSGEASGRFEGTTDAPVIRGDLVLDRVQVGEGILGSVRGGFRLADAGFSSDEGVEAFDGRLLFQGTIPLGGDGEGEWELVLRDLPLADAAAAARALGEGVPALEAAGRLRGSIAGSGPPSALRVRGTFEATELAFAGEGPFAFRGSASADAGAWRIDGTLTGTEGVRVPLELAADRAGALHGRIESEGARVEALAFVRERWPSLRGPMALEAAIAGSLSEPRATARIHLRDLVSGDEEPLPDATADLVLVGDRLAVRAASGERWSLTGAVGLGGDLSFEVEGRCAALDLRPLLVPGSDLAIRVSGAGRLRGSVRGEALGEGEATLERVEIARGTLRVTNAEPVEIVARRGEVQLAAVTLRDRDQELVLEGAFGPHQSKASARGQGDLRLLEMLVPGVASSRGAVDLEVRADRTGNAPWRIFGTARVEEAAMDLGFLVGVTEVAGELRFDGSRVEVPGVTGRLGGGDFLVAGELTREAGWDLGWAIRDANLAVPAWLDYRASGNGRFRGPFGGPRLSGEVEIVQALYDRRVEWAEFLPWFRREAKRSQQPASVPLDLDLVVFADGGLFVDNNLVEAELQSRFEVRGSGDQVRWNGRLDVVSGEFIFRRRHFAITAGTIQFHERRPLDPDLDFRGETTISTGEADYEILVEVTGTAERPRVEFLADDPSLSENDILALVTFGRTVSQLQAQGAGFELSEVLALTAGPRAGKFEERIYEFIPVDRIEIQPTFSRTSGTTEPRLSIGKDLTPELRALLSTGLGAERQQDVALEYQLTPRISVQGAWESQTKSQTGAFGGDLKFRVPFRTFRDLSPVPEGDPDPP